jgi:hypothetical protein
MKPSRRRSQIEVALEGSVDIDRVENAHAALLASAEKRRRSNSSSMKGLLMSFLPARRRTSLKRVTGESPKNGYSSGRSPHSGRKKRLNDGFCVAEPGLNSAVAASVRR